MLIIIFFIFTITCDSVQEVQSESDSEEEKQKKKRSEISREAEAKKALNAKATKDALLRRKLESTKTSANSGASSKEVLSDDNVSDVESTCSMHMNEHEDYPSLDDYVNSDVEDGTATGDTYSSPLKELFRKSMIDFVSWILP